jgi:hypothetical protein
MKAVLEVEESLLQKFHYDQAQRMFLSTFIDGHSGNPGRQVRFQMSVSVGEAYQIVITEFEAEAWENRNLAFFSNSESHRKGRANFVQPWKTFGISEYAQAVRVSTDAPHVGRKQGNQNARPTNTSRERYLLCLKCGKPVRFAKECFLNKFHPERKRERISTPNHGKRESKVALMLKLLVETPIIKKRCS